MNFQRLKISGPNFGHLITSITEKGASVKFKVTGRSMYPNVISGDILTIAPYRDRTPEIGDIVGLANLETNQVIVHRIIKIKDGLFLIKGDNVFKSDGLFPLKSIVGYVCFIERNNKQVSLKKISSQGTVFLSKIRFFWLSKFFCYLNFMKY